VKSHSFDNLLGASCELVQTCCCILEVSIGLSKNSRIGTGIESCHKRDVLLRCVQVVLSSRIAADNITDHAHREFDRGFSGPALKLVINSNKFYWRPRIFVPRVARGEIAGTVSSLLEPDH
jgi:hypothetical protein